MVRKCAANGCNQLFVKGSGIQFHRFPFSRPHVWEAWVKAVNRKDWQPKIHSSLCSRHFTKDAYVVKPGAIVQYLKEDAVPTIFRSICNQNMRQKKGGNAVDRRPSLKPKHPISTGTFPAVLLKDPRTIEIRGTKKSCTSGPLISLNGPNNTKESKKPIGRKLTFKKHFISIEPDTIGGMPRSTVKVGHIENVQVCFITSPFEFYVQLYSSCEKLNQLMDRISMECDSGEIKDAICFEKQSGCLARYSGNECWYRSLVLIKDNNLVKVHFVDYGNKEYVTSDNIKILPKDVSALPIQAIKCKLFGALETAETEAFRTLVEGKLLKVYFVAKNLFINCFEVVMMDEESNICINVMMGASVEAVESSISQIAKVVTKAEAAARSNMFKYLQIQPNPPKAVTVDQDTNSFIRKLEAPAEPAFSNIQPPSTEQMEIDLPSQSNMDKEAERIQIHQQKNKTLQLNSTQETILQTCTRKTQTTGESLGTYTNLRSRVKNLQNLLRRRDKKIKNLMRLISQFKAKFKTEDESDVYFDALQTYSLSNYQNNVLYYIAGFVCGRIRKTLDCAECAELLVVNKVSQCIDDEHCYANTVVDKCFLENIFRPNGGLLVASEPVFEIVKYCEESFLRTIEQGKNTRNHKLIERIVKHFVSRSNLFDEHSETGAIETEDKHSTKLIRRIVCTYFCLRRKSYKKHMAIKGQGIINVAKPKVSKTIQPSTMKVLQEKLSESTEQLTVGILQQELRKLTGQSNIKILFKPKGKQMAMKEQDRTVVQQQLTKPTPQSTVKILFKPKLTKQTLSNV